MDLSYLLITRRINSRLRTTGPPIYFHYISSERSRHFLLQLFQAKATYEGVYLIFFLKGSSINVIWYVFNGLLLFDRITNPTIGRGRVSLFLWIRVIFIAVSFSCLEVKLENVEKICVSLKVVAAGGFLRMKLKCINKEEA